MKNTVFLDALLCKNDSSTIPVWLMRQAGRYMAAYRDLRSKYSFEQMCLIPELAVTVTLQPICTFNLDAAILFSDILFPVRLLGIDLSFDPRPILSCQNWKTLQCPQDIPSALKETLPGIYQAARMLHTQLDRPLIGFAGAPWTLAAYIIGEEPQQFIQSSKQALLSLMAKLEDLIVAHLTLQIEAGCQAVQLFDSLSHIVPDDHLRELVVEPMERIKNRLPPCPLIYYKASSRLLPHVQNMPTALSFDESVDITSVRKTIPLHVAVQGNLDPELLTSPDLPSIVRHMCQGFNHDQGYIFNVSRGLPPTTSESSIKHLVDLVRRQP